MATQARRRDVQLVRAVAVLMVIAGHYAPGRFPGGYVGVDVFFVVSGFVLLGPLLWSGEQTRLRDFYARRARRILPAALTVIVVTLVVFGVFLSPQRIEEHARQALYSALFVGNVFLQDVPGGYFAPADPPPLLHFWSLAVEEQFYVVAPLLALGLIWLCRGNRSRLVAAVAGVTLASFALAAVLAQRDPQAAFYLLPSRAWEFGIGALAAALVTVPRRLGPVLLATGAAGLGAALLVLDPGSGVPGPAALLPTLATAAILLGARDLVVPGWLTPGVWIGDASYSLYLWHWPPLCWLLLDRGIDPLTRADRLLALGVAIVLAVLTHVLVERPLHHARLPLRLPRASVAVAVAAAVVVAGAGSLLPRLLPTSTGQEVAALAEAAVLAGPLQDTGFVPRNVRPALRHPDAAGRAPGGCHNEAGDATLNACVGGDHTATRTIALVGDSHALHWFPALDVVARQRGVRLAVLTKGYCPLPAVPGSGNADPSCETWRGAVRGYLLELRPQWVVLGSATGFYLRHLSGHPDVPGLLGRAWAQTRAGLPTGVDVLVLGDVPNPPRDPLACLVRNLARTTPCRFAPSSAHVRLTALERAAVTASGMAHVDPTGWLCGRQCPLLSGNVVVYRDRLGHLTFPAAQLLAPRIAAALRTPSPGPGA